MPEAPSAMPLEQAKAEARPSARKREKEDVMTGGAWGIGGE